MSDSDDTDFLLLIPPDFFNVNSDEEDIHRVPGRVVNELISQVNDLSSRLSQIESESSKSEKMDERKGSSPKKLDIHDVDRLLKEMETTQAEIESKLRQREIDFEKPKPPVSKKLSQLGENISTVPDLGLGMRALFDDDVEPPCVRKNMAPLGSDGVLQWKSVLGNEISPSRNSFSPDKRRPKYRKRLNLSGDGLSTTSTLEQDSIRRRFADVDDLLGAGDGREKTSSHDPALQFGTQKLLNLNTLWRDDSPRDSIGKLKQKLEEEQYRRKHLEDTIQSLQRKLLEEEEKVSVAIKVDESKDKAIRQITDAWKHLVDHWKKIEEHRHQATQNLLLEKENSKKLQQEVDKKVERWEREVGQALDLAADYKAKCESLEGELFSAQESLAGKIADFDELSSRAESQIRVLEEDRKALSEKLVLTQQELEKEKALNVDSQKKIDDLENTVSNLEAGKEIIQEQRETLNLRLQEERSRVSLLEAQNKALKETLNEAITKRDKAEEEAKNAIAQLDNVKKDVRAAYQSQLEAVVREKLTEFQNQLDSAQNQMQAELELQSKKHQEKFVQQKQALVGSHITEMRRLEAVHKEELHEVEQKLQECQRRCARLESGKKEIAQKLHSVMEQQWQQALSIITSELSTKKTDTDRQKEKEALFKQWSEEAEKRSSIALQEPLEPKRTEKVDEALNHGRVPPQQDQLLSYIQMLLERRPGHPIDSTTLSGLNDLTLSSDLFDIHSSEDAGRWNEVITKSNKDSEKLKAPWNK